MTTTTPLITIAIDGFSSSGKSTMAKVLARNIGYAYIDSGAMYRAITLFCIENNIINGSDVDLEKLKILLPEIKITFCVNPNNGVSEVCLNDENIESKIRDMRVSNCVSIISAIPFVRHALVKQQQAMGAEKGIVMDGRDIGTTVFPHAEMKVYVDASSQTRAKRRYDELQAKGVDVSYEEVLKNVCERDYIDQNRAESPLRKADDAIVLDNSNMTIKEQDAWLLNLYHAIIAKL